MIFSYVAIDRRGERIQDLLDAESLSAAQQELLRRGLFVLSVEAGRAGPSRARAAPAPGGSGAGAVSDGPLAWTPRARSSTTPSATGRELAVFARQMSMMLKAGASVVPALRALEEQSTRAAWRALMGELVERVESGASVHDALCRFPDTFSGTVRSIVAAGESTGTLGDSFQRIAGLLDSRERLRKRIISALAYPALLLVMAVSVVLTITLFVLPRFQQLFDMLETPTPALTQFMLGASAWLTTWWAPAIGAPLLGAGALWFWTRSPAGRDALGRLVLRVPLIGRAVSGVLLARLLLTWAALLRSRVPVLDAIRQTRDSVANVVFAKLVADVETAIVEGRSLSSVLRQSGYVPAPVVATIATGEDNGKLGESMEFVAGWLDEENDGLIRALTRLLEPVILIVMGLVVGGVCIALFLPLFDIATAAG
ncbi:MAG: type II secretion system F family protein [Phycisphaerae bacterium]